VVAPNPDYGHPDVAPKTPDRIAVYDTISGAAPLGISHVLVNGTFVVRNGDLIADARPGRPIRTGGASVPLASRAPPSHQQDERRRSERGDERELRVAPCIHDDAGERTR
jgi:hypothetical protein